MSDDSFTIKSLGSRVATLLALKEGDIVEVQRSQSDPHVLKIIRHPKEAIGEAAVGKEHKETENARG